MRLYLMQHGVNVSKDIDPDQPLSPVGAEQVEKAARAVRAMGIGFDLVLSSPKVRAVQTAQIMAKAGNTPKGALQTTELVKAMARPEATLELLREHRGTDSIFIAGHLPHLAHFVSFLACRDGELRLAVENAGLIHLTLADVLPGQARLEWYLRQRHLALLADSG